MKSRVREPVVAGQFYEEDPEKLKEQLVSCFLHSLGPGKMMDKKQKENKNKFMAAIVPHAGYVFSGPCASYAYSAIANSSFIPDTIILIGPNHTGLGNHHLSVSFQDFQTPLGIIKNNLTLAKEITKNSDAKNDETAHIHEHCLEVQLPFLQFIFKNQKFKIVPIVIATQDKEACEKLGKDLGKIIKDYGKKVLIIASSDFTHYGQNYNFVPFKPETNFNQQLYEFDKEAIDSILALDSDDFYKIAKEKTICGMAPIFILLKICKNLKLKDAKLLKQYASSEIIPNKNAVDYASIVFK